MIKIHHHQHQGGVGETTLTANPRRPAGGHGAARPSGRRRRPPSLSKYFPLAAASGSQPHRGDPARRGHRGVHHGRGLPEPRHRRCRTTPSHLPTGCSTGSTAASGCVSLCRLPSWRTPMTASDRYAGRHRPSAGRCPHRLPTSSSRRSPEVLSAREFRTARWSCWTGWSRAAPWAPRSGR